MVERICQGCSTSGPIKKVGLGVSLAAFISFGAAYCCKKLNRRFSLIGTMASGTAALALLFPSTPGRNQAQIQQSFQALKKKILDSQRLSCPYQQLAIIASASGREGKHWVVDHLSSKNPQKALDEALVKMHTILPEAPLHISSIELWVLYQDQNRSWHGISARDDFDGEDREVGVLPSNSPTVLFNAAGVQGRSLFSTLVSKVEPPPEAVKSAIALAYKIEGKWTVLGAACLGSQEEQRMRTEKLCEELSGAFLSEEGKPQFACGISFEKGGQSFHKFSSTVEWEVPEEFQVKLSEKLRELHIPGLLTKWPPTHFSRKLL